jgi:hypothetical protein
MIISLMENQQQIQSSRFTNRLKKIMLAVRNKVEEAAIPFIYLIILKKIFRIIKSPKQARG